MSPDLQMELLKILKESKGFILEQAPDVFQQTLSYGFYSELFSLGACLMCFGFGLGVIYKCKSKLHKRDGYYDDSSIPFFVGIGLASIVCFVSLILIVDSTQRVFKIKYAPKVYLLDHYTQKSCK